jgi:hypothetical protein
MQSESLASFLDALRLTPSTLAELASVISIVFGALLLGF